MATAARDVVLVLARELASSAASPMLIVDGKGTLVFINESAEQLLGTRFSDLGELSLEDWGKKWLPDEIGDAPMKELPFAVAMLQQRPAHGAMTIRAGGHKKIVEVTAYPLFSESEEFVGAVALFWEPHSV